MTQKQDKVREEWEKKFEEQFADFPGSAHWFMYIREFIRQALQAERERVVEERANEKEEK